MGKYDALHSFLERQEVERVPMTFAEIEKVIGSKLPQSQTIRAWWSNNPSNNVMTKAWLAAGYKTEQVDIESRKLVFRRDPAARRQAAPRHSGFAEEALARAPKDTGRHPIFGALKDVTWIAPGIDLTEPADPEWADLTESKEWGRMPE
jgi:hypothetical protein